jgi:phosphoglycolate phosphatase-like HAD superfamily hydrolase
LAGSRRQRVDAVLTDFDRTLVWLFEDRRRQWEACQDLLAIRADWGVPAPPGPDPADSDPYDLWADAYRWLVASAPARDAESLNDRIAACLAAHEVEAAASVGLLAGVGTTLRRLREQGIPVAVVSNNPTDAVWQALKANQVEGLVPAVLGREPGGDLKRLKPSPAMLRQALSMLDRAPERAVFAGDSVTDMAAAQAAGVPAVGVLGHSRARRSQLTAAGARWVVPGFADLEALLGDAGSGSPPLLEGPRA